SLVFGLCGAVTIIFRWPFFFKRSLYVQGIILFLLIGIFVVSFRYLWKQIYPQVRQLHKTKSWMLFGFSVLFSILIITFYVPDISIPPLPVTQHRLSISMSNSGNINESTQQIKIVELKIDEKAYPFSSCQITGKWMTSENSILLRDGGRLDCVFSKRMDSTLYILLEKEPRAGVARIQYDNRMPIDIDMFSIKTDQVERSFSDIPLVLLIVVNCCDVIFISWLVLITLVFTPNIKGISFFGKSKPTDRISIYLMYFIFILIYYQIKVNIGFNMISRGWNYFTGYQGAISAYGPVETYGKNTGDRNDINTCLNIERLVPGDQKVLNLNGFAAVEPCLFSPLLPRDKIVHHYETVAITEPYFHELMYGEPEVAYSLYKRLGINYFYLRKADTLFLPLGYSTALSPHLLRKNFDIFGETRDFYILTWRGNGKYPISDRLAEEIEIWFQNSKDQEKTPNNIWWRGKIGLDQWLNQLDQ
ncbi:MAG: hypothetical protein GYA60_08055, partial [Candidatus Methanofastidiosa archaeon]|nr:hypothetical protein [Candidatus Methanofastidiosa archaeon]